MSYTSRLKLTVDNFSPESDLIEVFSKKAGVVGVINPSQIASPPSGGAGAIQFSDGSAFASDASNLFWDNVNKRLGIGTSSPISKLQVNGTILSGSGSGDTYSSLGSALGNYGGVGSNYYTIGGTYYRTYNDSVSQLYFNGGGFQFRNAAIGAANSAIGFNSQMEVGVGGGGYLTLGTNVSGTINGAKFGILSSGSTSGTKAMIVLNSGYSELFQIRDDGAVGIGGAIYSGWKLSVQGDIKANRIDLYGSTGGGHAMAKIDDNGTLMRNNTFAIDGGTGNAGQQANLAVGEYFSTLARLYVKGSGSTSATTSLLVQNSGGTQALKVRDDGGVVLGNTTDFGVLYVPRSSTYGERVFMAMESGLNLMSTYSNDGLGFKANYNIFNGSIYFNGYLVGGSGTGSGATSYYNLGSGLNPYGGADDSVIGMSANSRIQGSAYGSFIKINPTLQLDSSANKVWGFYFNPTLSGAYSNANVFAFQSTYGGAYINTATPNASAILQADSTTQGFLKPRMTTTQKNAIATPAAGLEVFDTTLGRPCFYSGSAWVTL